MESQMVSDSLDLTIDKLTTEPPHTVRRAVLAWQGDPAELIAAAAMHPSPWVRSVILDHLLEASDEIDQRSLDELLTWLVHDPEDFVAFRAIEAIGLRGTTSAMRDLLMIVGKASERFVLRAGKPVGIGHAVVLKTIERIVGTRSKETLEALENELFPAGRQQDVVGLEGQDILDRQHPSRSELSSMVLVPTGPVRVGMPTDIDTAELLFDWSDVATPSTQEVGAFWIDNHPVTAEEYDAFASSRAAREHQACHPEEPPAKLHHRNTFHDARFLPDQPVTGVDWFDAYAYAHSKQKRLPTEFEWQRAAQGPDGRGYPWGGAFEIDAAQGIDRLLRESPKSIEHWRSQLIELRGLRVSPMMPATGALNVSPFGLVGTSGNCWEWTGSSFYSRRGLRPSVGTRDAIEIVYDWRSYATIKGGTWSSHRELLSPAFRGKDLLTDRHNEIGFRCAADVSDAD